jgi:hypothetical protein
MGGSASQVSPETDLLDLHGRVAVVTGAKCVITRLALIFALLGFSPDVDHQPLGG